MYTSLLRCVIARAFSQPVALSTHCLTGRRIHLLDQMNNIECDGKEKGACLPFQRNLIRGNISTNYVPKRC